MMEKSGLQVRMEADEEKLGVLLDRISLIEDKIMTQQRSQAVSETELKNILSLLGRIEASLKEYSDRVDRRIEALEGRVQVLEDKPATAWSTVVTGAIVGAVTAFTTWLIMRGGQ